MTSEESVREFAELDTTEAEFDAMMEQARAAKRGDHVGPAHTHGGLLRRWAAWAGRLTRPHRP